MTAVGDEEHRPYNRVLLSAVVTGAMSPDAMALQTEDWAATHHVDLRLGTGVARLDRAASTVVLTNSSTVDYDVAVPATGARSWIPPVAGLSDVDCGVVAFRTMDDGVHIRHAVRVGAAVAVLGGGLLGLELACAIAACGNQVTVVHPVGHLM